MDVFRLAASIVLDTSEYEQGLESASKETSDFEGKLKSGLATAAKVGAAALGAAAAGIVAFGKSAVEAGMQFDSSMSQVAATMGTTADQIQELRDFAMEMGAKTVFSATQAADALNYMALAGYDAEESMQALPNVLNLAAAGGIELAYASDMVTDAQSALGLSMEESAELVDKMAVASSKSNTSVAQLGEAILTVGGTAKNLAGGTTELSTALGILADNGIKGAEGGTALRNIILSLSAPTESAAKTMDKLGVKVYDTNGNMRPLNETFKDLNGILSTMTQGEQTQVLNELFNKVDLKSVNALLTNTGERFDELSGYIDNATGAAERMAETQLDNLAGDVTLMKSAFEGLQIAVSDELTPSLRGAVQVIMSMIGGAQEFVESGGLGAIIQTFANLTPIVAGATAALVTFKVATSISGIVDALSAATELLAAKFTILNAAMTANPIAAVAAGAVALVAVLGTTIAMFGGATTETQKFTNSLKESQKAYDELIGSIEEEQADTAKTADALKKLLAVEDKSAAQKELIKRKVDELNEAVPELGLAYDDAADSINMTTDALDALIEKAAGQEEYNAKVDRLSELYAEQEEIAARLAEAQEQLAEAESHAGEVTLISSSSYSAAAGAATDWDVAASSLRNEIDALTQSQEDNAAQTAQLEGEINDYAQAMQDAAQVATGMTPEIENIIGGMSELGASYEESYQKALESINGQMGLFEEMDGKAKTTADDLIKTLEDQVSYLDDYAANIQKAMELGVDEGLIKKLSDGSQESAQILDAIVKGGKDKVDELNKQFARVEEGKKQFAGTVAEMETDFKEKMGNMTQELQQAIIDMDYGELAEQVGENNIQGIINGSRRKMEDLITLYAQMGDAAMAAYKKAVGQASPSKKFARIGSYDIQGIITGAESERDNLFAAYEGLAEAAMDGYGTTTFQTETVDFASSSVGIASAAAINSTRGQSAAPIVLYATMVTPDGKVMAEYMADPLADYMDANGTPILNPS